MNFSSIYHSGNSRHITLIVLRNFVNRWRWQAKLGRIGMGTRYQRLISLIRCGNWTAAISFSLHLISLCSVTAVLYSSIAVRCWRCDEQSCVVVSSRPITKWRKIATHMMKSNLERSFESRSIANQKSNFTLGPSPTNGTTRTWSTMRLSSAVLMRASSGSMFHSSSSSCSKCFSVCAICWLMVGDLISMTTAWPAQRATTESLCYWFV